MVRRGPAPVGARAAVASLGRRGRRLRLGHRRAAQPRPASGVVRVRRLRDEPDTQRTRPGGRAAVRQPRPHVPVPPSPRRRRRGAPRGPRRPHIRLAGGHTGRGRRRAAAARPRLAGVRRGRRLRRLRDDPRGHAAGPSASRAVPAGPPGLRARVLRRRAPRAAGAGTRCGDSAAGRVPGGPDRRGRRRVGVPLRARADPRAARLLPGGGAASPRGRRSPRSSSRRPTSRWTSSPASTSSSA